MDLSGTWRAHPADEDLRRIFHDDDFDDRDWEPLTVPGHWRTAAALADFDGSLLYRRRFDLPAPTAGRRVWLRLDGVFAQGDVWLDGGYVGETDGYFFPHDFEVTEQVQQRREHVLAVEVGCAAVAAPENSRALTGAFQHGDHLRGWNPGGLWRPVHLTATGPIAIRHGRVLCREATEEQAVLALRLVLDTLDARPVHIRTRVAGIEHVQDLPLATGENRVEWAVTVPRPVRWWPHALGDQPLHDVRVDVSLEDGEISDQRTWRTGFRAIELRNWICRVNGERIFLKGVNLSPVRPDLGAATPSELDAVMRTVRAAGLDLVRLHTHISRPELYAAADRLGMLVWQDFPLHRRHARTVRREAMRQAREAVDLLGHHPSVMLWCGHDEPYAIGNATRHTAISPGMVPQQLPSWNRSILDRSVKRVFEKNDGTRPVIAHSGVLPHLPQLDGTDAHLWFGWYGGDVDDLGSFAANLPRHLRFVSAFGAQAAPAAMRVADLHRWPQLDWARLAEEHGLEVEVMSRVVPPERYANFEQWVNATQRHQARVIKHTIETLRRLKYRPTGGFAAYRLRDVTPQIGFGLIDSDGDAKAGWAALVDACRPLVVVADLLPQHLGPGSTLELDVHVVSDERVDRAGARVRATIRSPVGPRRWHWQGDIEADACVRVGTLEWIVPTTPGPVELDLELIAGDTRVTNRYCSRIT